MWNSCQVKELYRGGCRDDQPPPWAPARRGWRGDFATIPLDALQFKEGLGLLGSHLKRTKDLFLNHLRFWSAAGWLGFRYRPVSFCSEALSILGVILHHIGCNFIVSAIPGNDLSHLLGNIYHESIGISCLHFTRRTG